MQRQPGFIRIRKTVFVLIAVTAILVIATPVLAAYLGPNRTTTESHVETFDYGVWADKNDTSCKPKPGGACIQCTWERDPSRASCAINPETATYYSYKLGSRSEVVTTTVNHPPATISGAIQNCTLQNGWCVTSPNLFLTSIEPLPGYFIRIIEGTLNGALFACENSSCSVPLNEGNNSFTYWAISSWGDSSTMGSYSQKVDTISPNVGLDIIGTNGTNGWYVSPTKVTASGSDSTSGLYEALLSVNGGAWQPSADLNDGVYGITVKATDNAGNVSNSSKTISVDKTTPSLNVSLNGTAGNTGWYISNVTITALASDATSGISLLEFSADGGAYQSYTAPISFSDGHHTYQFKATDKAGNLTESPLQAVSVDTTFPAIDMTDESKLGETVDYNVQDEGSKLAVVGFVIDDEKERFPKIVWQGFVSGNKYKGDIVWDGKFKDGKQAPVGTYYVTIKASDAAGNESRRTGSITVEPLSFLQPIPPFRLPTALIEPAANSTLIQDSPAPTASTTLSTFGGTITSSMGAAVQSVLLSTGTSSSSTSPVSNILWGSAAAALIGWATATALEENKRRKKEEEQGRRQAEAAAAQLNAAEAARKAQLQAYNQHMENKMDKLDAIDDARWTASQVVIAKREKEKDKAAYDYRMGEHTGEQEVVDKWKEEQAKVERGKALEDFRAEERASSIAAAPSEEKPWWKSLPLWVSNGYGVAKGVEDTVNTASVVARPLEGGYVGLSAPRSIRDMFGLLGKRYKPSTLSLSSAGSSLVKSSVKNGTVGFNFGVSLLVNIYDYQWGQEKDKKVISHEFVVSTIVDMVVSTAVGVVAAGVVALVVAALVGLGFLAATLSTTALVVISIATVALAIGIGLGIDLGLEWPKKIKEAVNSRIDELQGEPNE